MSTLYPYQQQDLDTLFEALQRPGQPARLLYQLPTGGGKTRVFVEIARRFMDYTDQSVIILTHRVELSRQTAAVLKKLGVANQVINSSVKTLKSQTKQQCFVAMVETLRNRLKTGMMAPGRVGLIIVDEAHNNAFQKLLGKFPNAAVIGVTATPLSSNVDKPMNQTYHQLISGESIASLISQNYLAKPTTWRYDVELDSLRTGLSGDFTISTSDELYSSPAMMDLLLHAYEAHAKRKKTLIFNNGIFTSRNVCQLFEQAGYPVRHLDNRTPDAERTEILSWFKRTKGAILTSVSLLTTGFDEPTVQAVILNRATTSLTLYHQMIGRGSRRLPNKKTFTIIDLGNNVERFGAWETPLDWQLIFERPEAFIQSLNAAAPGTGHAIPPELREKFPNSLNIGFDIQTAYQEALDRQVKPKTVIRDAIRQHARLCIENSTGIADAIALAEELDKEISWRVKQYGKCLGRVTRNYLDWLETDYKDRLKKLLEKYMMRFGADSNQELPKSA